ncbi:MAG: hypothetical protein JW715_12785 [Sedimentisphaerales bacterium]|nr:hypothetical protein [Sedimentisphaerales bacterium]
MNKLLWFACLLVVVAAAGCNTDVVCTKRLKTLENKCVYVAALDSEDPQVGKVIRDILEKELVRRNVRICDSDTATIFLSGATFMTTRATSSDGFFGASSSSNQAIESISVVAKDRNGELLLSASYDNKKRYTASKLGKEFGSVLASKLK